jgi:antitoxin PrlF
VRKALNLRPGDDEVEWEIRGDEAIVRRARVEGQDDPALQPFLALLQNDIVAHPERLRGMPHSLYERILAVTRGTDGTVDEGIEGPVAL